jgi:Leucine-rich repeat (LRR) protein
MNIKTFALSLLLLFPAFVWAQERSAEEIAGTERLKDKSIERLRAAGDRLLDSLANETNLRYGTGPESGNMQRMGTSVQLLSQPPSNLTVAQFNALVDLYDSTSISQPWTDSTGWFSAVKNTVVDVSGWYGVEISTEGKLIGLNLDRNNLNGFLPSTLGDLTDLGNLILPNNPLLTGRIPPSITNLTKMVYLNLALNNHTGSIPEDIGNLTGMKTWLMYANPQLTGELPTSIANLTALEMFLAADNNLNGRIPEVFGHLPNLSNLVLSGNDFNDSVPTDLGSGSNLVVLNLSDNRLSGPIPDSLGNMPHLADLFLYANKLTGSIPSSLGSISTLQNLYLSINNLEDSIPPSLGNLSNLKILHLEDCGLEGKVPTQIYGLSNLTGLFLSNNSLTGGLDSLVGQLSSLETLYLYGSGFEGPLPATLSNLAHLRDFNIAYNDFSGTIPANMMCGSPGITQFHVLNNHRLYGTIPPCIANATELVNISGAGFTFSDILPILSNFSGNSMVYANQEPVDTVRTDTAYYGYPFTLEAGVDRDTDPSSKFRWFKKGPNNTEIPLGPSPSVSGHSYTFDNMLYADSGEYFYRIWNDAAPALVLTGRTVTVSVVDKDLMDINLSIYDIYCGTVFYPLISNEEQCEIVAYSWNFGDGGTSGDMNPVHRFGSAGTYPVSLEVSYRCGSSFVFTSSAGRQFSYSGDTSIPPDMLRDSLLLIRSEVNRKVIAADAVSYAENWPQNHVSTALRERQSYLNATAGVWRQESVFQYDTERSYSTDTKLSSDGTYILNGFNWENSSLDAVPDWTRANTATSYTPYGGEAENRDVLGVYSASLYGYGGQLLTAQGIDTKYGEMAFTGFEHGDGRVSGNWRFGNDPLNAMEEYRVITGNSFFAIVDATTAALQGVDTVSLLPRSGSATAKARDRVPVLCMEPHPENSRWSVLVFGGSVSLGPWFGTMVYNRPLQEPQTATVDSLYSHSGKGSLKVTGTETFSQDILRLDTARSYHISLWVSVKQNPAAPVLDGGIHLDLVFRNTGGQSLGTKRFYPAGPVIEQWQQLKGDFVFPTGAAAFDLVLSSGTNPSLWADDLRLFPVSGNMESYVYDYANHRLMAVLNGENFGTFYYYDAEGNLRLVKKETVDGIKTLSETEQYLLERD